VDTAVITGAYALGGVLVGGALNWARDSIAVRRSAVRERDQMVASLDAACINLLLEARMWQTLARPSWRLRQFAFGLLGEIPELPVPTAPSMTKVSITDIGYLFLRWTGKAAVRSLPREAPVAQAESMRTTVLPLLSEIGVLCIRLSMTGDETIKDAVDQIGSAAETLLDHIADPQDRYAKSEEKVRRAIGQLRRARDAADARPWRRQALRRRIGPSAPAAPPMGTDG
jgi:hypothetical protein